MARKTSPKVRLDSFKTPTKPIKIKKTDVNFFPTAGHQTLERSNKIDILNMTTTTHEKFASSIDEEGIERQNSFQHSVKGSKPKLGSKILEESSKNLKVRSNNYEGGNNDSRWKEMNDNLSIGGGNHSDHESSSNLDGTDGVVKNLTR